MSDNITHILPFLFELDALKTVERRSYIAGGLRPENSAEHSWHLAMACWAFAEALQLQVDISKLLKMALVHDLGEIDAGDTFLYGAGRAEAHIKEREGVARLAHHPANPIKDMLAVWDEQENGDSIEARLLKVVDRILPLQLNVESQGIAWRENGVAREQVLKMNGFIGEEFPTLLSWIEEQVELAVQAGWLKESKQPN